MHTIPYKIDEVAEVIELGTSNENFYDIGMEDTPHTFFANGILVHNSSYMSAEPLAKLDKIPEDKMLDYSIKLSKTIVHRINKFYEYMIPKVFNVHPSKNRIEIVPDVIAKKALWIKKKNYALLKVFDMEKNVPLKNKSGKDGKLEVKGLAVVRSSFPAAFRKFGSTFLEELLRDFGQKELSEKLMSFEESIDNYSIIELAKTTSIKFVSQNGDHDYNPHGRQLFRYVKGTPAQVKAGLAFNDLLKVWKLDKQIPLLHHAEKIKWVYMLPNEYCIDALAFRADDTDPTEILEFVEEYIDRKKMYSSELYKKLETIYSAIGWQMPNRGGELASKTFDFGDSW
jgi:hypothetical protein